MSTNARYVGIWITPSVPFVESTYILWTTESKNQDGPASFNITMIMFLVWHVQMHEFQKPKVTTGLIPHFLRRKKIQGL